MAKPIKNTPILYGKDALDFIKKSNEQLSEEKRQEEQARVRENAERFRQMVSIEV